VVSATDNNDMDTTTTASPGAGRPDEGRLRVHRLLLGTGLVVAVFYALADLLVENVLRIESVWGQVLEVVVMAAVTSLVLWLGVLRPLLGQVAGERRATAAHQLQIQATARSQHFRSQLHRALEMSGTEESAYRSTARALKVVLGDRDAELLLADSSDAHLKRALSLVEDGPASCGVVSPHDCPAVRGSQTLVFPHSAELDACPHLEGRPGGAVSAACVPMSVGGRSIGVLHTVSEVGSPPSGADLAGIEAIASQAGSRIGMLRVMSATTLQAATDPLTGLMNRRSLENKVHDMTRRGAPYALAMADLDHFKRLNDTHGHDAGDRALRLFARTTLRVFRSEDLICRYGGEEFVFVFPERTVEEAVRALERLRQEVLLALTSGTVPGFTASFGVAHSQDSSSLEDVCRTADAALFRAKREGRDRIITDEAPGSVPEPVAVPVPG
jgi:diguanylate cyclase (GGDEF)-like protein